MTHDNVAESTGRASSTGARSPSAAMFCAFALVLGGCAATPSIPALSPATGDPQDRGLSLHAGPTVKELVAHINALLKNAMLNGLEDQDTSDEFAKLIKYNFIATPELNVKVTNTEGLSPSLAFITPYTSSTNLTLTVGGQLNGTQDRNFDFTYVVDLPKLLNAQDLEMAQCHHSSAAVQEILELKRKEEGVAPSKKTCAPLGDRKDDDVDQKDHVVYKKDEFRGSTGLAGDLALGETLRNGLDVMEAASKLNVYGAGGPSQEELAGLRNASVALQDASRDLRSKPANRDALRTFEFKLQSYQDELSDLQPKAPSLPLATTEELRAELSKTENELGRVRTVLNAVEQKTRQPDVAAQARAVSGEVTKTLAATATTTAAPPAKGGGGSPSGTKFGSTIDFTVVMGLSGGPNWTLKYFKGPGGGSSGPLSTSRTYFDSLQIAFVATCQEKANKAPHDYWDTVPECQSDKSGQVAGAVAAGQSELSSMRVLSLQQALQPLVQVPQ